MESSRENKAHQAIRKYMMFCFVSDVLVNIIDDLRDTPLNQHKTKQMLNNLEKELEKHIEKNYNNFNNSKQELDEIKPIEIYFNLQRSYDHLIDFIKNTHPEEMKLYVEGMQKMKEEGYPFSKVESFYRKLDK